MARSLVTWLAICALGLIWTTTASASQGSCNTQLTRVANSRTVSADALDQNLFNIAVLHYVNIERCNHGLTPLRSDNNLIRATSQHSRHMASNAYVSHKSRQSGYRNLQDRLSKARVNYRVAGENVIKSFVLRSIVKLLAVTAQIAALATQVMEAPFRAIPMKRWLRILSYCGWHPQRTAKTFCTVISVVLAQLLA